MFHTLSNTPIAESIFRVNFWKTPSPTRTTLLLGGGAAAALGLGYLLLKPGEAKAAQSHTPDIVGSGICTRWDYVDPSTLGGTGRYRVEIMLPPTQGAAFSSYDKFLSAMDEVQKAMPGLKIEGAWLGVLAYPKGKQLPPEWRTDLDTYGDAMRLRVQYVSAYPNLGDIFARMFGEAIMGGTPLPVLHAWKCMSSPAIAPQKLTYQSVTVEDSDGGVTFIPGAHYIISMRAVPNSSSQAMAAQLASRGFVIVTSLDRDGAWGYEVYYRGAQPEKWAKNSVPAGTYVQQLALPIDY